MTRNNNIYYNDDRYKIEEANRIETVNRIEALENIVKNHTRTEKHLEKHSDITSSEKLSEVIVKQCERESNIDSLEAKILNNGQRNLNQTDQIIGLEKNYTFASGYIENNKDNMNQESLNNMNKKQQNRRDEMNELI